MMSITKPLYYEVLVKNVNPHGRTNITNTLNRSCLDFLNKNYIEADLEVIACSEYVARKLFIDFYEKNIKFTSRAMIYFFIRNFVQTDESGWRDDRKQFYSAGLFEVFPIRTSRKALSF